MPISQIVQVRQKFFDYFCDECEKVVNSSDYGTQLVNKNSNFSSYETEHTEQSRVYEFKDLPIPRNATLGKSVFEYYDLLI